MADETSGMFMKFNKIDGGAETDAFKKQIYMQNMPSSC